MRGFGAPEASENISGGEEACAETAARNLKELAGARFSLPSYGRVEFLKPRLSTNFPSERLVTNKRPEHPQAHTKTPQSIRIGPVDSREPRAGRLLCLRPW
jgi:hypothetical protein